MKNVLLPFIIILVALASFGLWVVLTAPDVQLDEPDRESPTTETVPSEYHPTKLSQEESAYGFQTMVDPQRNVTTLVHPNSPCWLELPNPSTAPSQDAAPKATDFVGPESCAKCHPKQYEGFVETAHASTSSLASQETIDGPFSASNNKITTVHPDLTFQMLREGEQHFQQIQFRQLSRKVPFDIVTGSGKSAQTYLFWEEDRLYQMHMSYFKPLQSWINSPGYHEGTAWFTRETIPKCVQCHMTYMEWKPGTANAYVKAATIFGVSCERCHGPARAHVEHHEQNPSDKTARHIANPSKLEPERANDVCAQCHLGTAQPLQAPFSFRPGDELSAHFHVFPEEEGKGQVHTSNQLQRMKLSKCFLESERMTCIDCHNPHQNERGNKRLFSERCQQCHQPPECGQHDVLGASLAENCIDCHMGMGYDDSIQLETGSDIHMPLLRDHFIRVLPAATDQFFKQREQSE